MSTNKNEDIKRTHHLLKALVITTFVLKKKSSFKFECKPFKIEIIQTETINNTR